MKQPTISTTSSSSTSNILIRKPRLNSSYLSIFIAFILFAILLYGQNISCIVGKDYLHINQHRPPPSSSATGKPFLSDLAGKRPLENIAKIKVNKLVNLVIDLLEKDYKINHLLPFSIGKTEIINGCDIFSGRWVWDPLNRPLYREPECPYIQPQLTCQEHGRPDRDYQFWRWQPHGCSLPSFNASLVLETLRNKRMMYVGDSLNRGQYVSMVCLVHSLIPNHSKSMETFDSFTVFTIKDYNATIEFYWAPFLLESNSDNAVIHRISDRIVRKGSINKHGKHWKGVDIIVFNTYLWWMTGVDFKILHGSFDDKEKKIVEVSTENAYRMAIRDILKWTMKNMDPEKTRVFFMGMSPSHQKSIDWGGKSNENCYNETQPIKDLNYWSSDCNKSIMKVIGDVFKKHKFPITFLNITQLSLYRRDAHTSIYKKQWSPLTPEQIANPTSYADCTHWCLPGLQDTWNELLFAKLFYP